MKTIWLPLIIGLIGGFGFEVHPGTASWHEQDLIDLKPRYVHVMFSWEQQETAPGVYVWSPGLLEDIAIYARHKVTVIAILHDTPAFYRRESRSCAPPADEYMDEMQAFVRAASQAYPYIQVWEFWNEPDFTNGLDGFYGCWGSYGGGVYAAWLDAFYRAVKDVDAADKVMFGSLGTSSNTDFLAQAADADYDILGVHLYANLGQSIDSQIANGLEYRERLRALTDKPVWITETALMCAGGICTASEEQLQADWMRAVHHSWHGKTLYPVISWYCLFENQWAGVGMYRENNVKKPVWFAFRDMWLDSANGGLR